MKKYAGFLAVALAVILAIPAVAVGVMTIDVEPDVKVYVDDAPIDAGDTHGNPEAFIYNGTTYIAAKAVSLSLGEDVKWDGSTRSVYIGRHEGSSAYLLNVCPPYDGSRFLTPTTIKMAGMKYANCITFDTSAAGYVLCNLGGKYDKLTFTVGHVDDWAYHHGEPQCNIYLDGELVFSLDLDREMMPREYTLALDGALQMKIEVDDSAWAYALADIRVS